jgi:hypothetical protein
MVDVAGATGYARVGKKRNLRAIAIVLSESYLMSHIHGPIVRTPDSQDDGKDRLYAGNVAYLDKLVGR